MLRRTSDVEVDVYVKEINQLTWPFDENFDFRCLLFSSTGFHAEKKKGARGRAVVSLFVIYLQFLKRYYW